MPNKLKQPCKAFGCPALVDRGYCAEHATPWQPLEGKRSSAAKRGYDARWKRYRRFFLARNPLCVQCQRVNRTTAATVVDHIQPHQGNRDLFWAANNHQALCASCHNAKSARERLG